MAENRCIYFGLVAWKLVVYFCLVYNLVVKDLLF